MHQSFSMKLCYHISPRRYLMCRKCWLKLPERLRETLCDLRRTEDGQSQGTLRCNPNPGWIEEAKQVLLSA